MNSSLSAHEVNPEDFLHFVETDEFREDWRSLGLDVETDLLALQTAIMLAPESTPVIQGTGGLRKLRFSPSKNKGGKSGAIRVCYAYFKEHWTVLLVMAYSKRERENISQSDRNAIQDYLLFIRNFLDTRNDSK